MSVALDLDVLAEELRRVHGAHTVVLYGSRARGDASPTSDVDVIVVRSEGGSDRDVRRWRGFDLDVHVIDERDLATRLVKHATGLADARVLTQDAGSGDRLVSRARYLLTEPPPPIARGDLDALWGWGDKMHARIRSTDSTLATFQRANVIVNSLAAWADVRQRWFHGTKATLARLPREAPALNDALVAAMAPGADVTAFDRLLDAVFDPALRPPPRD